MERLGLDSFWKGGVPNMTDLDLDRLFSEDRKTALPGEPDPKTTLEAVRRRASLDRKRSPTPEIRDWSPEVWVMLGVSAIAAGLGVAWVMRSPSKMYLLLAIPSIELVALKNLIREETVS